jgi:hypothetical protein
VNCGFLLTAMVTIARSMRQRKLVDDEEDKIRWLEMIALMHLNVMQ